MDLFQRTAGILGEPGLARLSSSSVIIFGLGGVGSFACEALVRTGLGRLSIVDFDAIEASNINRQIQATSQNIGVSKTQALKERLLQINPNAAVNCIEKKLVAGEENEFFANKCFNCVVDAIDDVNAKISLLLYCQRNNFAVVAAMGAAMRRDPSQLQWGDLLTSKGDPLARRVRQGFRQGGGTTGVEVVYSQEQIDAHQQGLKGSLIQMSGSMGLMVASRVIHRLLEENNH